jgi:two-component system sensor histidine kinase KdpD
MRAVRQHAGPLLVSICGVSVITFVAYRVIPVNATTVGFAYLLLVLIVASTWGFLEASVASLLAALLFNFFFLPPLGTFVISDPQNWVAVFSLFAASLIASRLSAAVKQRALEAMERQQDVERLYTFSRAILLIDATTPFPKQLVQKLAEIFDLNAVLYDRRSDQVYHAGPFDIQGVEEQLREASLQGTSFTKGKAVITAVRLGAEPIAGLAFEGRHMPDSVVQGIANLLAIGLERARAQHLAHEVEAARQTERLRTALIDAMAHEFKTPLTSIKAATTSLLATSEQTEETRTGLLKIADEEADHLKELIDDAVEMARLDAADIDIEAEPSELGEIARDVVASMRTAIDSRPLEIVVDPDLPKVALDRRLVKLAIKQLLDNALKYSPLGTLVTLRVQRGDGAISLEITDQGKGIPAQEQQRVFERFYRGPSARARIPGSGLGLSIAQRIVHAHQGELTVASGPGETRFRMTFPVTTEENSP